MVSKKTEINGAPTTLNSIVCISPATETSFFDINDVPNHFNAKAIVHRFHKRMLPARRTVTELAAALGFVVIVNGNHVVAFNPNYAHYQITQIAEEDKYRPSQQTKISWHVNGQERKVFVSQSVDEVLSLLPKAAKHMELSSIMQAARPHHVREMPLAARTADA